MDYTIEKDISYLEGSSNPRHTLDVYRPEVMNEEKLPTVVYFHGGGWDHGNKESAERRFKHFYDTGYLFISVGYRLSDEEAWPAQIDDAVAALKFVQTQMPEVDVERIALWGSSAGGHIAGLLAGGCRNDSLQTFPEIKCLVNYCGPITIDQFVATLTGEERVSSPVMKLLGGDHEKTQAYAKEAAVTSWVKPGYPPTLNVHGDQDEVVPMLQSEVFTQTILQVGSEARLLVAENSPHRVDCDMVRSEVKAFFQQKL